MTVLESEIHDEFGDRASLAESVIFDLRRAASGRTTRVESILSDVGMRYDENRDWPSGEDRTGLLGHTTGIPPRDGEPLRLNVHGTSNE